MCPECGAVIQKTEREVKHVEGELSEIDLEKKKEERKKRIAECKTLDELCAYGKAMKYKHPYAWAGHIFTARKLRRTKYAH